jgi:tRNA threonylcarbamoyladenosine biosynthesis protein TsaB
MIMKKKTWAAGRDLNREIVGVLDDFVEGKWSGIDGLIVFRGPGSFTGLRIGIATMNTIAYAEKIPIVGAGGENWLAEGIDKLKIGENEKVVLPEYGASAHITRPKK